MLPEYIVAYVCESLLRISAFMLNSYALRLDNKGAHHPRARFAACASAGHEKNQIQN